MSTLASDLGERVQQAISILHRIARMYEPFRQANEVYR